MMLLPASRPLAAALRARAAAQHAAGCGGRRDGSRSIAVEQRGSAERREDEGEGRVATELARDLDGGGR
jgi:hypothetical protein